MNRVNLTEKYVSPWNLTILDGKVTAQSLSCLAAGDVDGDGLNEVITGGKGCLLWYRPETAEKGIISEGIHVHVAADIKDIDDDGLMEVVVGQAKEIGKEEWMIVLYKPHKDINQTWEHYIVDSEFQGGPHDILFYDLDGDGEQEIVAIACYSSTPGIYAYKRKNGIDGVWDKYPIAEGVFNEGLSIGDVNADGIPEIVCGPSIYSAPEEGLFKGLWKRKIYAPDFREMCRTAMVDITGNGCPDIVITDSEYVDGWLSWFENRVLEDPDNPWVEHRIDEGLIYSHSFSVLKDEKTGKVNIFVGEMEQGGFGASYNKNARLITYTSEENGKNWTKEVIFRGEGAHQAIMYDIDKDGEPEIVGKSYGGDTKHPKVEIWKKTGPVPWLDNVKHTLIDSAKPHTGVDILACDVDNDGAADILCGCWWYRNPDWQRYSIPGIIQVINAFDIDGDGRQELIAIKSPEEPVKDFYKNLNSRLCWLKPIDPVNGQWEIYDIGEGSGDWPHGSLIAPLLTNGGLAMVIGYHKAETYPEIFEIPSDPKKGLWPKRVLAQIHYGEEFAVCDINSDGLLDIAAGCYWLENKGDGTFIPHNVTEDFTAARLVVMDVNGDGKPDIVMAEEILDFQKKMTPFSRVAWFENPGRDYHKNWNMHIIDSVRCGHSLGMGDLDGDGEPEIVLGEHDPFWPYRSQCNLYVYKKNDSKGNTWKRFTVDRRFEHHDGTRVTSLNPGKLSIISHGWKDSKYVHMWEFEL